MSNPILNERSLKAAGGWAAPQPGTAAGEYYPPIDDGPVSSWRPGAMTIKGTISATATLFALLLASGAIGWSQTKSMTYDAQGNAQIGFPGLAWVGLIVGLACVFGLYFKPMLAKYLGPVYAIAQGFFVGALSKMYETYYNGIVVQAAGATICVFAVMLVLYRTNIIKVTDRFRRIVVGATLGVAVFYGVCLLIRLFAGPGSVSFLASPSLLGIGFSLLVAGLAAMNLALDFDFIERGSQQGLDKNFEWFAAFGLLVTIIWLYLEILRLLAKLRER
ncbi:MAG TPA: Bax inhibitor-1/YccA family protein [Ilumatobacter sp.]|nr:Bax inhibitor-1/YccA family protein [Ilumatobacter sp.]